MRQFLIVVFVILGSCRGSRVQQNNASSYGEVKQSHVVAPSKASDAEQQADEDNPSDESLKKLEESLQPFSLVFGEFEIADNAFKLTEDSYTTEWYAPLEADSNEMDEIVDFEELEPEFQAALQNTSSSIVTIKPDRKIYRNKEALEPGCYGYLLEDENGLFLIDVSHRYQSIDEWVSELKMSISLLSSGRICLDDNGLLAAVDNMSIYGLPTFSNENFAEYLWSQGFIAAVDDEEEVSAEDSNEISGESDDELNLAGLRFFSKPKPTATPHTVLNTVPIKKTTHSTAPLKEFSLSRGQSFSMSVSHSKIKGVKPEQLDAETDRIMALAFPTDVRAGGTDLRLSLVQKNAIRSHVNGMLEAGQRPETFSIVLTTEAIVRGGRKQRAQLNSAVANTARRQRIRGVSQVEEVKMLKAASLNTNSAVLAATKPELGAIKANTLVVHINHNP